MVDPELGDQDLGGPLTDPRDRAQQPQLRVGFQNAVHDVDQR